VSGISAETYAELSKIAPVVATSMDQSDWSTPWYETLRTAGLITGEHEKAEAIITALQDRIEEIAASHPQWQDMTASVATIDESEIGVFLDQDIRAQLLSQLGFTIVPGLEEVETSDETYATISQERLSMIEADVVIWVSWDGDVEPVRTLALRERSTFRQEGREVFADVVLSGAFSWSSPLSLNFLLDELVPALEQAADGNPDTPVEMTVSAGLID
jgi:iron complex transport system substrate-binding protein